LQHPDNRSQVAWQVRNGAHHLRGPQATTFRLQQGVWLRCNLYKNRVQVCKLCYGTGHRSDICPKPQVKCCPAAEKRIPTRTTRAPPNVSSVGEHISPAPNNVARELKIHSSSSRASSNNKHNSPTKTLSPTMLNPGAGQGSDDKRHYTRPLAPSPRTPEAEEAAAPHPEAAAATEEPAAAKAEAASSPAAA
ncbi:unnamed protein product, partial [Ixodes persulcatus]